MKLSHEDLALSERTQLFLFYLLHSLFLSCNQKTEIDCNDLSMKKYKGIPNSYQAFEKNCQSVNIKYTEKLCQSALVVLLKTNNLSEVKKQFGDAVEGCFTADDLERFSD